MKGISLTIVYYMLNIREGSQPLDRREETIPLKATKDYKGRNHLVVRSQIIRKVNYLVWLANIAVMPKK